MQRGEVIAAIDEPQCRHVSSPSPIPDPLRLHLPSPLAHAAKLYPRRRLCVMCRFVIYKGTKPVQLSHLLTRPCHSIINQAFDSRLRLARRRPINGDGFGVGESASFYPPSKVVERPRLHIQAGMTPFSTRNSEVSLVSSPLSLRYGYCSSLYDVTRLTNMQAWNNVNLTRLAEKTKSPLVL